MLDILEGEEMSEPKFWKAVNHNGRSLGVFKTRRRALREADDYTYCTGQATGIRPATTSERQEYVDARQAAGLSIDD